MAVRKTYRDRAFLVLLTINLFPIGNPRKIRPCNKILLKDLFLKVRSLLKSNVGTFGSGATAFVTINAGKLASCTRYFSGKNTKKDLFGCGEAGQCVLVPTRSIGMAGASRAWVFSDGNTVVHVCLASDSLLTASGNQLGRVQDENRWGLAFPGTPQATLAASTGLRFVRGLNGRRFTVVGIRRLWLSRTGRKNQKFFYR